MRLRRRYLIVLGMEKYNSNIYYGSTNLVPYLNSPTMIFYPSPKGWVTMSPDGIRIRMY